MVEQGLLANLLAQLSLPLMNLGMLGDKEKRKDQEILPRDAGLVLLSLAGIRERTRAPRN
jgi:hypothetical protein